MLYQILDNKIKWLNMDNQPSIHQHYHIKQQPNPLNKISTIATTRAKFTKAVIKGRPKKKEKNIQEFDEILSQHQQTIFGLVLSYTFKSLKKDYKKYSKCGFLHKNLADNSNFYLEIKEALKKNKIISQEYKNILEIQFQESTQFVNFLNKLLWIGPSCIADELLYIISHFLMNFQNFISRFRNIESLKTQQIDQIKQTAKRFSENEFQHFWQKFFYISFKSPHLKQLESNMEYMKKNFIEFVQVFIVSTILTIGNFSENPYFSKYYTYDYEVQERIQIIKRKEKKIQQKKLVIQKQIQKFKIPIAKLNPYIIQISQYQQIKNCIEYIQFNQNFNQIVLPIYPSFYDQNSTYFNYM